VKLNQIQIRDPFVLVHDDHYYLYGSTDPNIWRGPGIGFDVYPCVESGVFTDFEAGVAAFRPSDGFWSHTNFWAPEVYYHAHSFIMFATFKPDVGRRGTAVLQADSPLGPFVPLSDGPVTPANWECLDGTLFVDKTGDPWMVFCHEWQQVGDGEICAMRLADDLRTAKGEPQLMFTASQAPWAAPLANRPPGSYVTDGPNIRRLGSGALAMLWSSFDAAGNYCLGVATSTDGDLLGPWQQADQPLYGGDAGHGMIFESLDGRLFLAVHSPNDTPNERAKFIGLTDIDGALALTGEVIQ